MYAQKIKSNLLVTGQSGFVGGHLLHLLHRSDSHYNVATATAPYDLLDVDSLDAYVANANADAVIHLAGQTFVPQSFSDPLATIQTNLIGTLNLFEALKRHNFHGTFLYVSSGDIYGCVPVEALPIAESRPAQPHNPYAVSKAAAELLCYQWSRTEAWRIIIARPFNHIGPGQRADFVIADAAKQIARIKHGLQPPQLVFGDIDVSRDFLDVEDVIGAYMILLRHGENGVTYNVCSGREYTIRQLINMMLEIAQVDASITRDPARLRSASQQRVIGDNNRLLALSPWQPKPIEETLRAILLDWEERVVNA